MPPVGDRGMFGSVQSESGFDVGEGCISDVYPERGERIREVGSTVVAADDVSELTSGVVQRGKTRLVERVHPGPDKQRRTKVYQVERGTVRGSSRFYGVDASVEAGIAWGRGDEGTI